VSQDYSAARDKWTASIHVVKTAKPPDPNRLIEGYHAHARVSIKLAGIWQSDGTQQAMDAARTVYRGAVEDLEQSHPLIYPADAIRICKNETLRAEIEIGLGDLEVRSVHRAQAEVHRLQAKTLIERLDRAGLKHTEIKGSHRTWPSSPSESKPWPRESDLPVVEVGEIEDLSPQSNRIQRMPLKLKQISSSLRSLDLTSAHLTFPPKVGSVSSRSITYILSRETHVPLRVR